MEYIRKTSEEIEATTKFKLYLNSLLNVIDDDIHEKLWERLIDCIVYKEQLKRKVEFSEARVKELEKELESAKAQNLERYKEYWELAEVVEAKNKRILELEGKVKELFYDIYLADINHIDKVWPEWAEKNNIKI